MNFSIRLRVKTGQPNDRKGRRILNKEIFSLLSDLKRDTTYAFQTFFVHAISELGVPEAQKRCVRNRYIYVFCSWKLKFDRVRPGKPYTRFGIQST